MEHLTLEEIVFAVDGKIAFTGNDMNFTCVNTDTRKIEKDSIFVALKGERFDANEYVVSASKNGANVCIVDKILFEEQEIDARTTIVLVEDTKMALKALATYYRSKLHIKVIGITGSTGKTSTKDLTAAALSSKYKVFKTKGNFNNEIGLPLMIFQLDNSYDIAVLEMGMSDFNEIHRLAQIAKPDIALITNIGISHIENLKTRENILKAKLEITDFFTGDNSLIINAEDDLLQKIEKKSYKILKTGEKHVYNFNAVDIILKEESIEFFVNEEGKYQNKKIIVNVPGKHNVLNTLLAIAAARNFGVSYEEISEGLKNIEFTSMRLDIVKGDKFTIIDDCYNASPDSMMAAIDVLMNVSGNRKIAILGTMKELGNKAEEAHEEIGRYAKEKKVDLLITVGEVNAAYKKGYGDELSFVEFENIQDVMEYLEKNIYDADTILIKASRSMKFENIVNKLKSINC